MSTSLLAPQEQNDFSAGSQLDVAPQLIDQRGAYLVENGLLNDDGSVYKRGGSRKHTKAAFGENGKLIWEGHLLPGRRTFLANSADFGVLSSSDDEVVNLAGAGLTGVPKVAVAFRDLLFIGGGTIYGGSRKGADYSAGTAATTGGSKIVKGTATAWNANVDQGMLFRTGAGERIYIVARVVNDTEIELNEPYEGSTAGGKVYTLKRLEAATTPYISADIYFVAGSRLIAAEGNIVHFSTIDKPHSYQDTIFPQETVVQNVHELEEGINILAGQTIGIDRALLFHTGGITTISNLAKAIVDGLGNSQHRIDVYSRDVAVWGNGAGISAHRGTLVVPAVDNLYLLDGTSAPSSIGDAIIPRYRQRLMEGLTPGQAWVAREHYFLPLVDSAGHPRDLICVRLDKPYSSRNKTLFPTSFLSGAGAQIAAGIPRHPEVAGEAPASLAMTSDGFVVDVLPFFEPEATNCLDHDNSVFVMQLTTRDYGVGGEAIARWRKLEMFYELIAATEEGSPEVFAEIGTGVRDSDAIVWDAFIWDEADWPEDATSIFRALEEPNAGANAGAKSELIQNAHVWLAGERVRYARFRLTCADPVAKLTIRALQIWPVQPGGARLSKVA